MRSADCPKGARAGNTDVLHSSIGSGEIPKTGLDRFDELAVGTKQYDRWKANVENRGFSVVEEAMRRGSHADVDPVTKVVRVDPKQFTYLDLLHESRHIRQVEKVAASGIDIGPREIAWFEKGAYEYERRVLNAAREVREGRTAVSPKYSNFIDDQIGNYWKSSYRKKYLFSPSTKQYFDSIWR